MARSSAVTAAAVGRSTPNAISPATRPPSTGPRPAIAGTTPPSIASIESVAIWVGGQHDAERQRRAGQPQKILQPEHRRVADACREQRRTHAARRQSRTPALDGECRVNGAPERDRGQGERGGESDDHAGRRPCRGQRPQGDERHPAQHENRRQLGEPIPHRGNRRLRPRRAAAQADEADAAGFPAWRRRQVPGGDPAQRRKRGPQHGHLAALRAQEAAPPRTGDEQADHIQQESGGGVGGPGGRQSFEARARRCARWRAKYNHRRGCAASQLDLSGRADAGWWRRWRPSC